MAKANKTVETNASVEKFFDKVQPEKKRDDCRAIAAMMSEVTKEPAKMWGTGIVGFGSYHYEYESGRTGDTCRVGFAPRKANIVLYLMGVVKDEGAELKKLGKIKTGGGCVYINSLSEIDTTILKKLIKKSFNYYN